MITARGRIVHRVVVNRPGGETSCWQSVHLADRPRGETTRTGGEMSRGLNVKVAKRPVTSMLVYCAYILYVCHAYDDIPYRPRHVSS